eukprot:1141903-Rhodomonas_salina.1
MFHRTRRRAAPPSPRQQHPVPDALHAIVQTRPIKPSDPQKQQWQLEAVKQLAFDQYKIHIDDNAAVDPLIVIMTVLDKSPEPRTDV